MSINIQESWKYFRNYDGSFSIFPIEENSDSFESAMVAKVFTDGVSRPESKARVIAASPELYRGYVFLHETLKATKLFMVSKGLEAPELYSKLDAVIEQAGELINRV